jgi:glutathione S-transferase
LVDIRRDQAVTLILYTHPLSSFCQKALTALYENDTPFEARLVGTDQARAAELRALWPVGKFPALVDDRRLVFDATTIIEWLDAAHPGRTRFLPADPQAAVEARMLDRFFDNYVLGPQSRIVANAIGRDPCDEAAERARLDTAYAWLDAWMEERTWAAAGAFGLADCAAAPALLYADWTHAIPHTHTHLWAYRDRLLARPSYARALDEARPYRGMFPLGAPEDRD